MINFRFGVLSSYKINNSMVALESKVIKCVTFSHFGL